MALFGGYLSTNLANLFASKFIARPDAKAKQLPDGKWIVHTQTGRHDGPRIPWRREDINAHIEGTQSFGHYLLSQESNCKLFAFDIDLTKAGKLPVSEYFANESEPSFYEEPDLRTAWLTRSHPGRSFMKLQFKEMAHMLLSAIVHEIGIPCAAVYSGGKGIHVYAFTGLISASEARLGAQIILDSVGGFKPLRGENFFHHENYPNLDIELFPKQDSLNGKDLGNLMRLPLGRNRKSKDPTFFIDMTSPMAEMKPMDPKTALTIENPWVPF